MATQTVFRLTSRNGPDGLQAFQEPVPTAAKYEVLVKIRSVSLNYRDIAIANSTYPQAVKDKLIPCSDMAGEVVQVGDAVTGFSVGDGVITPVSTSLLYGPVRAPTGKSYDSWGGLSDGMLREYVAIPAHMAIKLPESSHSFTQWSCLPGTVSTVWNAFYGNKRLMPGDIVLLQGTGGVSLSGLIFAKAAGATTIVTSSSDEKLAYVKSNFGADHTINYKTHPNWAAEVQRITGGKGADHILEVGGAGTMQQSFNAVAYGGVITAIGFLSKLPEGAKTPDVSMSAVIKNCSVRGILGGSKQQLEEAVRFMASRDLPMPVDKTVGFTRDEIVAAMEYVAAGKHIGKVCINVD